MTELLAGIPTGARVVLGLVAIFGPVIAVILSNYMQGSKLKESLLNETKLNIAVMQERIEEQKAFATKEIETQKQLVEAQIKTTASGLVPWPKHDESIRRIHEHIEKYNIENRAVMDEIRQGVHEIEITTTEIAGRIEKLETVNAGQNDRIDRLERKANGRTRRRS